MGLQVDGSTELVAIIGHPVRQVKSPGNFNDEFGRIGANQLMFAIDVAPEGVPACVAFIRAWKNFRGGVVTVPHKQAFARQMDSLSRRSQALGAVNVFRRDADGQLIGDMVDGLGFLGAARGHGFDPQAKAALIIGAGGVGSAIAYALAEAGAKSITLLEADAGRETALRELLGRDFGVTTPAFEGSLAAFDLVVNATPMGMNGDGQLPLSVETLATLNPKAHVADVVTSPAVTPFLALARERGHTIQTGPEMALAQMQVLGEAMGIFAGAQGVQS